MKASCKFGLGWCYYSYQSIPYNHIVAVSLGLKEFETIFGWASVWHGLFKSKITVQSQLQFVRLIKDFHFPRDLTRQ